MEYPIPYKRYQEHLRDGRLIGLRCKGCDSIIFPPRAVCLDCNKRDFEEVELKGDGTIKTFTVIRVAPEPRKGPYTIVMVELTEGPYVIGNLWDVDPDKVGMEVIGKKVKMRPYKVSGDMLLRGEFYIPGFYLT